VDRCTLAAPSLAKLIVSGPDVFFDTDENGAIVGTGSRWTGTTRTGRNDGLNCADWTENYFGEGLVGMGFYNETFPSHWTDGPSGPCSSRNRLMCFEQ